METTLPPTTGRSPTHSFNGATAFRPWKLPRIQRASPLPDRLQWSHSLSAMETVLVDGDFPDDVLPSMEPQPFGHGNAANLWRGAAGPHGPSMEPQPFGHGNAANLWRGAAGPHGPSMEPQPFGHGNWFNAEAEAERLADPSMEPQPFGHGNNSGPTKESPGFPAFNGATAFRPWKQFRADKRIAGIPCLQWSHSLSAMETGNNVVFCNGIRRLQWSHSLSAMETTAHCRNWCDCPALQWSHSLSAMETIQTKGQI